MASLSDETRHLSLGCFFTAPFVSADDIFTEIAEHLRGLPREKALKKYQNRNFYEAWVARSREDVVNFCRIKSTVGKQGGIHNA